MKSMSVKKWLLSIMVLLLAVGFVSIKTEAAGKKTIKVDGLPGTITSTGIHKFAKKGKYIYISDDYGSEIKKYNTKTGKNYSNYLYR